MLPDPNLEAPYQRMCAEDDKFATEVSRLYEDLVYQLRENAEDCLDRYPALADAVWQLAEYKAENGLS